MNNKPHRASPLPIKGEMPRGQRGSFHFSLKMSGIYIHIPFCKSRCAYCGFYSTTYSSMQDEYVDALISELHMRKEYIASQRVRTIYIGGGTPSVLSPENIERLCRSLLEFACERNTQSLDCERENETMTSEYGNPDVEEFTMECNPDDVTPEFAQLLRRVGINRVSMGAQTFSDERLRFLNRRHKAQQVEKAVEILRGAGIRNISVDLIFGFPCQTLEQWEQDIDKAISLDVEHISAYSLMYEEGTPLFSKLEKGEIEEVSEDVSLAMYDMLIDKLSVAGYEHYEISNFAREGYRSKHNSSYWHGIPYLGLGAAAHSYDCKSRQWNVSSLQEYVGLMKEAALNGYASVEQRIMEREVLTENEKYNDIVTTALRTREGIDIAQLSASQREYLLKATKNAITNNLLVLEDDHLHLTRKGLFVSDSIMVEAICSPS